MHSRRCGSKCGADDDDPGGGLGVDTRQLEKAWLIVNPGELRIYLGLTLGIDQRNHMGHNPLGHFSNTPLPRGSCSPFLNGPPRFPFRHVSAVQSRHRPSRRLARGDRTEIWICSVRRFRSRIAPRQQRRRRQIERPEKRPHAILGDDLQSHPTTDCAYNPTSHEYCGMDCPSEPPSLGSKLNCHPSGERDLGAKTMLPVVSV